MSFFSSAFFIARKDVAYLLTRRETILWTFVMPIVFFYFIGTVTGGFAGPAPGSKDRLAVRGGVNGGFLVDEIVRRLEAQRYEIGRPATDAEFATFARRLTIPAPTPPYETFTDAVLAGQRQTLSFDRQGDAMNGNYDQVRVARAVYEVVADLAVVKTNGQAPSAEAFAAIAAMPRTLTLTVKPAGKRLEPPLGFAQAVPGTMVMFTMLVLLTSGAVTLVVERDQGLLRRLASAPMSPGSIVLGKWMGRMALGLVQIGFAMITGTVLFKMDWGSARFPPASRSCSPTSRGHLRKPPASACSLRRSSPPSAAAGGRSKSHPSGCRSCHSRCRPDGR
jgi:ABC-type Na+ efflux pump permease subunit